MKTTINQNTLWHVLLVSTLALFEGVAILASTNDLAITAISYSDEPAIRLGAKSSPLQCVIMNYGPETLGSISGDGKTNAQSIRLIAYLARDDNDTNAIYVGDYILTLYLGAGESSTNQLAGFTVPESSYDRYYIRIDLDLNWYGGVIDPQSTNNRNIGMGILFVEAPAVITLEPASTTLLQPGSVTLQAAARGSLPLQYQWRHQGTLLLGQTNSFLEVNAALENGAGAYDLLVRNDYGAVTSRVASIYLPWADGQQPNVGGWIQGFLPRANYQVNESLMVTNNNVLVVEAGSKLFFQSGQSLTVVGSIQAQGTVENPITLQGTGKPGPGGWAGVRIQSEAFITNIFEQVEVLGATTGIDIITSTAKIRLSNCRVALCRDYGLDISPSGYMGEEYAVIENTIMCSNKIGVNVSGFASGCSGSRGTVSLKRCEVSYNQDSGVECYGAGSSMFGCSFSRTGSGEATLEACFIHHNGTGIHVTAWDGYWANGYAKASLFNNLILLNGDAVRIEGDDYSSLEMVNNTVAHNQGAALYYGADQLYALSIINNLLVGNETGFSVKTIPTNGTPVFACNNVYGSTRANWTNWPADFGALTTTNRLGLPADRYENLSLEPLLMSGMSFHLSANSPLINAGTTNMAPLFDYEAELRDLSPDIGFDEFRDSIPPEQADADGDGMPDWWELQFKLDPLKNDANLDSDQDGLSNLLEFQYHTNPKMEDTDQDGSTDYCEIVADSNPIDPESHPGKELQIATAVEITLPTRTGVNYQLQVSTNLTEWLDLNTQVVGDGKLHQWYYPVSGSLKLFYRVKP